jgi:radical SAM protein with 4Fe4S-binding SPASM domain
VVNATPGLLGRMARAIGDDYGRLRTRVEALAGHGAGPGLYAYRIQEGADRLRLHLRIHEDRTGLLFINAVQTVHLSPTEAEMAKLALDGVRSDRALLALSTAYPDVSPDTLRAQFQRMTRVIERVSRPGRDCVLCDLELAQPPALSVRAQAPYKTDLALSYSCNNNCSHCYNEPGRRAMPSMPTEDWRRVLDRLWSIGVPYVIFTGGEPTLHPDLIELIAYAESLGQITGLNTNGRRLSEPGFAEDLVRAGCDHAQITLASQRPELHDRIVGAPGAFAETVEGIRRALAAGLHTLTNTTLVRGNADEAVEIVDFLHGFGVRTFAMNGMIHSGCGVRHPAALGTDELAPILARVIARADALGMRFLWYTPTEHCRLSPIEAGLGIRCCNAAEYSVCVEPSGDVLPCQSYYEPAGNILRDSWESIWTSELFTTIRYRRERPREGGLPSKCWDCDQLRVCGGGCPLERRVTHTEVMSA